MTILAIPVLARFRASIFALSMALIFAAAALAPAPARAQGTCPCMTVATIVQACQGADPASIKRYDVHGKGGNRHNLKCPGMQWPFAVINTWAIDAVQCSNGVTATNMPDSQIPVCIGVLDAAASQLGAQVQ